jgi:hypothetical protein
VYGVVLPKFFLFCVKTIKIVQYKVLD